MKDRIFIRRRTLWLGGAALLFTGMVWLVGKDRDGVTWIKEPERWQASRLAFLGRWESLVRIQVFYIRQWLFGPRRTVQEEAVIFESRTADWLVLMTNVVSARTNQLGEVVAVMRETLGWGTALSERPGVNVLAHRRFLNVYGSPSKIDNYEQRMVGTPTSLTPAQLGWALHFNPKVQAGGIGLSCFFTHTGLDVAWDPAQPEEVLRTLARTNLHFGARVKFPEGGSVLLFSPPATNGAGLWRGAYLRPRVLPRTSQR